MSQKEPSAEEKMLIEICEATKDSLSALPESVRSWWRERKRSEIQAEIETLRTEKAAALAKITNMDSEIDSVTKQMEKLKQDREGLRVHVCYLSIETLQLEEELKKYT